MRKTHLCCLIAGLLFLGPAARTVRPAPQGGTRASTEDIKIKVARLGVGSKARATVTLTDGTRVKGYVSQAGETDFVLRDRKTDVPTTIRYADVVKFERNKGHSTAKHIAIGVGIGVGAFLIILFATLSHLD